MRAQYCKIIAIFFIVFHISYVHSMDYDLEEAYKAQFTKEFGYTLIGEKPASFEEHDNRYLYLHPAVTTKFLNSLEETFKSSKNLVFKVFKRESPEPLDFTAELINIRAIKKLATENQDLKNFIDKNFKSEKAFYATLRDPHIELFDALKRNAYIIGIVFGYGNTNADYFCQRCKVREYLNEKYDDNFLPFNTPNILPWHPKKSSFRSVYTWPPIEKLEALPDFRALEEEWKKIREVWWELRPEMNATFPYYIALPFYVCRHGGDSEAVREKYERAREKLADLFYEKSFQQAVTEEAHRD